MSDAPNLIVLYDGVCGLCNGMVRFVLKRDRRDRFRFAPLQSEFARKLLDKHSNATTESLCVVLDFGQSGEHILTHSTAAIGIFHELGIFWRGLSVLFSAVPRPVRDWAYDSVARHRYRIFGKYDACPLPRPEQRQKFLDLA